METYELIKHATSLAKANKFDEAISFLNELFKTHDVSDAEVIKVIPYYQKAGRYFEVENHCKDVLIPLVKEIMMCTFSHKCTEIQDAFINLSIYKIYNKLALTAQREKKIIDESEFIIKSNFHYQLYETNLAIGEKIELELEFLNLQNIWGTDFNKWPEMFKRRFSGYISNT